MSQVKIYASGDGSLSFVHSHEGKATGERVTMTAATVAIIQGGNPYEAFRLIELHGEPRLIPDIVRQGAALLYDGGEYIERNGELFAWDKVDKSFHLLANLSKIAALKFFIANEKTLYLPAGKNNACNRL